MAKLTPHEKALKRKRGLTRDQARFLGSLSVEELQLLDQRGNIRDVYAQRAWDNLPVSIHDEETLNYRREVIKRRLGLSDGPGDLLERVQFSDGEVRYMPHVTKPTRAFLFKQLMASGGLSGLREYYRGDGARWVRHQWGSIASGGRSWNTAEGGLSVDAFGKGDYVTGVASSALRESDRSASYLQSPHVMGNKSVFSNTESELELAFIGILNFEVYKALVTTERGGLPVIERYLTRSQRRYALRPGVDYATEFNRIDSYEWLGKSIKSGLSPKEVNFIAEVTARSIVPLSPVPER